MVQGGAKAGTLPRWGRLRTTGREDPEEVLTVVTPPAAGLKGEDGEPGAGSLSKFGVSLAALARSGVGCGGPRLGGAAGTGRAIPGDRRNPGHVDGDLRTLMPGEAVSDDLKAAPVGEGCANVEVPEEDIGGDTRTGLTTDRGGGALEGGRAAHEHPRGGASGAVVTEWIQGTATAAEPRRWRQRQT